MALSFIGTKNLSADTIQNIEPRFVHTPYIINEPDNSLFQYYIKPGTNEAWDKKANVLLGQYVLLPWQDNQHHLTTRAAAKIGAKQFPQIGAIGFYTDLYTSQSYILAPVHAKIETFDPPTLAATLVGDVVKIVITPPEKVKYSCYKVVFRSGFFAVEYVVYNLNSDVPAPPVRGDYTVHAVGYNEVEGIYSSWSNVIDIPVATGKNTWKPDPIALRMSDLLDVNLVDLLNAQMLRFNATTQKWENVNTARVVEITLLASAWVVDTELNTYTQVVDIEGITEFSKVDLQPSAEQLIIFHQRDVNFTTVNEDGTIVVYAVGDKPLNDYTIQATVTEVTS